MIITKQQNLRKTILTALFVLAGLMLFIDPALAHESHSLKDDLTLWKAVVLGMVEGLTEFLPVSSTGHLLGAKEFLDLGHTEITEEAIDSYIVSIQIGAIFAVAVLYSSRLKQMMRGISGESLEGRQILTSLIVAFIPTALIGYFASDFVKDELYGLPPVAGAWIAGGIGILAIHKRHFFRIEGSGLESLSPMQATAIGFVQALALWPGVSRSLVTILAAVAIGLSLKAAVEFSFLLGFVTLAAATIFELGANGQEVVDNFGYSAPIIGILVAFFTAIVSVRWMVNWLETKSFAVFGYYRILVGVAALILIAVGYF